MIQEKKAAFATPENHRKFIDFQSEKQADLNGVEVVPGEPSMADAEGFDPVTEVEAGRKAASSVYGALRVRTANQTLIDAASRPDPVDLYYSLWLEGEVCCLFADTNVGKSVYAVQIAEHIAASRRVLYVDCELSDKQFQLRYTDPTTKAMHNFSDNFCRADRDVVAACADTGEADILKNIEDAAVGVGATVVVVDNITYLCNAVEKGEDAGVLMKRLVSLKLKYGWSLLVIAHTPKRRLYEPISENDLAGSKKIANFLDSSFAIGKSAKDPRLRYVKQIKQRTVPMRYGADNVLVYELDKPGDYLHFVFKGYGSEADHLTPLDTGAAVDGAVAELRKDGKSIRQIATELNMGKSKVGEIVKRLDAGTEPESGQDTDLFTTEKTGENAI